MRAVRRYVVRADLEGVTGIVSFDQVVEGNAWYSWGRELFMGDLLSLVRGLLDGGAEDVLVYDQHYRARNVDLSRVPEGVRVICGKPVYRADWPGGLDGSASGLILLGFHSRKGTPGGLLDHSYDLDTRELRLNGLPVGEIGMEAAIAGDYGVPTVLVTGDSAGIAEARKLLPGVTCVTVKEALGRDGALCYPSRLTGRWIEEAAREVVVHPPPIEPFRVKPPVRLDVELHAGALLGALRRRFPRTFFTRARLSLLAKTVTEAWSTYLQMKQEIGF